MCVLVVAVWILACYGTVPPDPSDSTHDASNNDQTFINVQGGLQVSSAAQFGGRRQRVAPMALDQGIGDPACWSCHNRSEHTLSAACGGRLCQSTMRARESPGCSLGLALRVTRWPRAATLHTCAQRTDTLNDSSSSTASQAPRAARFKGV